MKRRTRFGRTIGKESSRFNSNLTYEAIRFDVPLLY